MTRFVSIFNFGTFYEKKVPTRFVIIYHLNLRFLTKKNVIYANKKRFRHLFFGFYHNKNLGILYIVDTYYDNKINVQKNVQKCPIILSTSQKMW